MQHTQLIAGIITTLIVGSLILWLAGPRIDWTSVVPETPFWEPWFEESTTPSRSAGKVGKRPSRSEVVAARVDALHGVPVFDNGAVRNNFGRNVTADGYNLGLKYQCVEFVKRYYYEHLSHKMPDPYGNARDFFNAGLEDGAYNTDRGLYQFSNGSPKPPRPKDILVWGSSPYNKFGHVAIISSVKKDKVEVVQQNPGPGNPNREWLPLKSTGGRWKVDMPYVVGWLGKR